MSVVQNLQERAEVVRPGQKARVQNGRAHAVLQRARRRGTALLAMMILAGRRVAALPRLSRRRWGVQQTATGLVALGVLLGMLFKGAVEPQVPAAVAVDQRSSGSPSAAVAAAPLLLSPTATPAPTATPLSSPTARPSPTLHPTWTPAPALIPSPVPVQTPASSPSAAALVVPEPFPVPGPNAFVPSTTLPIPTPVLPVAVAPDAVNIVVLGSDRRPDWSEWHTDAVHVVSIQRDRGTVSVISIPRDLYLYIPSLWMSRINFADFYGEAYGYEGGGPALVRDTLLYNLGIRVDHYVRTNFDGLVAIVDIVGGVDIPVHCGLSDHWPHPDEDGEYPILTVEPGMHHFDGETALWYARSRMTTSVFSRERRQQQVLQALWHTGRDAGILSRVPALWRQGRDMVTTDLTLAGMLDLARVALTLEDQNVRFYNIGADVVTPWTTPYGGAVFLPCWEEIRPLVAEAMAPIPEARLHRTYMPVEVWNGTANPDWDLLAADRLYRAGFAAVVGDPDRRDYAETRLILFNEQTKGTGAGYLQRMFSIPDSHVTHQPNGSATFGFRLIVGADYQTCPEP